MNECRQSGFTYLLILAAVAVLAIFAQAAAPLNSRIMQQDRQDELLFRGQAYRAAIESYYLADESRAEYPRSLEALLQDPRFVYRRHLRKLYSDPLGERGWVILRADDGGIRGVASSSNLVPLKRRGFPPSLAHFEAARSYGDWIFEFQPAEP